MAIIINGKIARNVPNGAEGIDVPSIKVNGSALEAGTKLYKHTILSGTKKIIYINTKSSAYTGLQAICDDFVNTVAAIYQPDVRISLILGCKMASGELNVYWMDETAASKAYISTFTSDTVTAL